MTIPAILVGGALLLFGRQLFWLFVGGTGFAAGMALAADAFQGPQEWVVLTIAILAGLIGALLATFLQRVAVGADRFLAGGYVLLNVASELGHHDWIWLAFLSFPSLSGNCRWSANLRPTPQWRSPRSSLGAYS
jgi:hypothetical protein